jgi:hypothetical protein
MSFGYKPVCGKWSLTASPLLRPPSLPRSTGAGTQRLGGFQAGTPDSRQAGLIDPANQHAVENGYSVKIWWSRKLP